MGTYLPGRRRRCLAPLTALVCALLAVLAASPTAGAETTGAETASAPALAGPSSPTATTGVAAATARGTAYLPGSAYPHKVRPRTASWSGDGSDLLLNLTWSRWTNAVAVGRGVERVDACTPDCASGHLTGYPVTLRASAPRYLRCGVFFSTVAVTFTKKVPSSRRRHYVFRVSTVANSIELAAFGSCPS